MVPRQSNASPRRESAPLVVLALLLNFVPALPAATAAAAPARRAQAQASTFVRQLALKTNDIVINKQTQKIYASVPSRREKSRAFVLMQYFGYLRRNPNDAPEPGLDFRGYNFWLGKLDQFGGNFIQAEMVKAFITSTEYRQRFGPN